MAGPTSSSLRAAPDEDKDNATLLRATTRRPLFWYIPMGSSAGPPAGGGSGLQLCEVGLGGWWSDVGICRRCRGWCAEGRVAAVLLAHRRVSSLAWSIIQFQERSEYPYE